MPCARSFLCDVNVSLKKYLSFSINSITVSNKYHGTLVQPSLGSEMVGGDRFCLGKGKDPIIFCGEVRRSDSLAKLRLRNTRRGPRKSAMATPKMVPKSNKRLCVFWFKHVAKPQVMTESREPHLTGRESHVSQAEVQSPNFSKGAKATRDFVLKVPLALY